MELDQLFFLDNYEADSNRRNTADDRKIMYNIRVECIRAFIHVNKL